MSAASPSFFICFRRADTLDGGAGNDLVCDQQGADALFGGEGVLDLLFWTGPPSTVSGGDPDVATCAPDVTAVVPACASTLPVNDPWWSFCPTW